MFADYDILYIGQIDFKCLKSYRPLVKKDKEDINWEHCKEASSKDKEKAKSHNPFFANQPQAQTSKKRQGRWQQGFSATGVYAINVAKKNKDKVKNLSHVECYISKQKGYHASTYHK